MTKQEAEALRKRIPKEAWHQVRAKLGQTNGQYLVHLHDTEAKSSVNISSLGEWIAHSLNKRNRPGRESEPEPELRINQVTIKED